MERSDEQLMRATRHGDAEAFGEFFARHSAIVLAYLARRCEREAAADLLAETVASALLAVHDRRAPRGPTAAPWLLTIARHKLIDLRRRGRVEDVARRRLALERLEPSDEDLGRIEALGADVEGALAGLPEHQRVVLRARILDERAYDEIARELNTTETAVRQRVSRACGVCEPTVRTCDDRLSRHPPGAARRRQPSTLAGAAATLEVAQRRSGDLRGKRGSARARGYRRVAAADR